MISNKGQAPTKLMVYIIAVVVLVVVIMGIVNSGIIDSLKTILPGFEQVKQTPGVLGQVRYDILNGEMMKYDGDWKKIDGLLEFYTLKSSLSEQELKNSFDLFYLGDNRPREELYQKDGERIIANGVLSNEQIFDIDWSIKKATFSRGTLSVARQTGGANAIVGYYYVDMYGKAVYFEYISGDKDVRVSEGPLSGENRYNMITKAVEWRDSVLEKPISMGGESFCVSRVDVQYLVVDLTESGKTECI